MTRTRHRVRIAKGVYRDQWGFAATVKVGRQQRDKGFKRDAGLKTIKAWQDDCRVALRKLAPNAARGTFAADAVRHLESVAAMPTIKQRTQHIDLWVAEFGARRQTIQSVEISSVLTRWRLAGCAAATVNKRRTALMHLYTVLNGKSVPNPVRGTEKAKEPEPEARALSYRHVQKILAALPDGGQGLHGPVTMRRRRRPDSGCWPLPDCRAHSSSGCGLTTWTCGGRS